MIQVILNNPYRISDVLPTASARDIQKQKQKVSTFAKVGKTVASVNDYPFFPTVQWSVEQIQKAFSDLEQDQNKVIYALFWFIKDNNFDEIALTHLQQSNGQKTLEIWRNLIAGKSLTEINRASINNYSTYLLARGSTFDALKKGIRLKLTLIHSLYFKELVYKIVDETYTFDVNKIESVFIDTLLNELQNTYQLNEILDIFSSSETAVSYLEKKFSSGPLHAIESMIAETDDKLNAQPNQAYQLGIRLFKNSAEDRKILQDLLDSDSFKYKSLMDALAKQIMRCGTRYANDYETEEALTAAIELLEYAKEISESTDLLVEIDKNIEALNENKSFIPAAKEIANLVSIIEEFKDDTEAYDLSISDVKKFVDECQPIVEALEESLSYEEYLNFSSAVVNLALGALISIVNKAQEDFDIKFQLDNDKLAVMLELQNIIRPALVLSRELHDFDLNLDLQQHFYKNHEVLKKLYDDISHPINIALAQDRNRPTSSSKSKMSDEILGWGVIIFVAIIVIKACG